MRTRSLRSLVAATLAAGVCYALPPTASAQQAAETGPEPAPAVEDVGDDPTPDLPDATQPGKAGESPWMRGAEIGVDVLLVRPLSFVTLCAGAGFVYPASLLAGPNTKNVREEVVEVFWTNPLDNLTKRELGELY